jgi:hypothetical protein
MQPDPGRADSRIPDAAALLTAALLLGLGAHAVLTVPVHHDIGWTLHLAHKLRAGATLYVDIIEINPPLIHWFALLASVLGGVTGLGDVVAYHTLVVVVIGTAIGLTWHLLRWLFAGSHPHARAFLIVLLAFLAGPFAEYEFGQREHLVFATLLPYVVGTAAYLHRGQFSRVPLFASGVLAAFGMAMKPYFVPIWLGTELYAWNRGGRRSLMRPQALGVLAGFATYGVAALWYARDYVRVARWGMAAYGDFFPLPLSALVFSRGTLIAAGAVLLLLLVRSPRELVHVRRLSAFAILVLLAAVYVQSKGWDYHWYPVLALAALGGGVAGTGGLLRGRVAPVGRRLVGELPTLRLSSRYAAGVALCALLAAGMLRADRTIQRWGVLAGEPYFLPTMIDYVAPLAPHGSILPITTSMQAAIPLVNYTQLRHGSRFPALWMLPSAYAEERLALPGGAYRPRAEMDAVEAYAFDALIEDLSRRPELVIVDRRPPSPRLHGFDYLEYYGQSAEFSALLAEYLEVGMVGDRYRIFLHSRAAEALGVTRRP